jgi:hypothetical protein
MLKFPPAAVSWHKNKSLKERGTAVEVLFRYECLAKGYIPHVPDGDPRCHDTIVMNPTNGNCKVTQSRGVTHQVTHRAKANCQRQSFSYKALALCLNRKLHLRDSIVETLAVFIVPEKAWYLIPVDKIVSGTLSLRPHIENSKGRYEKYREKWNTFGYGVNPIWL